MTKRVVNDTTGETLRFKTLHEAQSYRDAHEWDDVVIFGQGGVVLGYSAGHSARQPITSAELAALEINGERVTHAAQGRAVVIAGFYFFDSSHKPSMHAIAKHLSYFWEAA